MDTFNEFRARADALLTEGYQLWKESGLPALPPSDRCLAVDAAVGAYTGAHAAQFAAACQCFYLFRKLHGMAETYPTWATLLGDYFFSQFSKHLIPIDSVPLIDAFSGFLASDARRQSGTETYLSFIRSLPAVIKL